LQGQSAGTFAATGVETVTVISKGSTSGSSTTAVAVNNTNSLKTLNVTGDQKVFLSVTDNSVTKVDASTATADVSINVATAVANTDINIVGSAKDDTITIGVLGTADTVDGGAGNDTLEFTGNTGTTPLTKVTGFEKVQLTASSAGAGFTVDTSVVSGMSTFITSLTDTTDGTALTATFSKFSDTATLEVIKSAQPDYTGDSNAITVTSATNTTTNSFSGILSGIGNSATLGLASLTADNAETINLTSNNDTDATVTSNLVLSLASTDAKTVNLTGAASLQITAVSLPNVTKIDASGLTKNFMIDAGANTVARTITGGAGNDTLEAGSGNDTINGGAGNDVIVTGGGADSIVAGEGNDTVNVGVAAAYNVNFNGGTAPTVTYSTTSQLVNLSGGAGNDTFTFDESAITYQDTVNGGDNTDTVVIFSDASGTVLTATGASTDTFKNVTNVEKIQLRDNNTGAGNTLGLTITDSGLTTTFNGSATFEAYGNTSTDVITVNAGGVIGSSGTVKFTANSSNIGILAYVGGAGNDVFTGGTVNDTATYANGIYLTSADTLAGGTGTDTLVINSTNAATLLASQIANVSSFETINLDGVTAAATTAMSLTFSDAVAVANADSSSNTLTVTRLNASAAADDTGTTKVDGTAVVSTKLNLSGALGADTLIGGGADDTLAGGTGIDSLVGGAGNDIFSYTANTDISTSEVIDGGAGTGDAIQVNGASLAVDFTNATITGIENLDLIGSAGGASTVTFNYAQLAATTKFVESTPVATEDVVVINAGVGTNDVSGFAFDANRVLGVTITNAGTNAAFSVNVTGTTKADIITGGNNNDILVGGLGADIITGGTGVDSIILTEATAAQDVVVTTVNTAYTTATADTITGFTPGVGGDIVQIDISDSTAIANLGILTQGTGLTANPITGDLQVKTVAKGAGATALAAGDEILVITGTYTNLAAVITDVGSQAGTTAISWSGQPSGGAVANGFLVVWSDGANTYVSAISDTDATGNAGWLSSELNGTNIVTLTGVLTGFNTINFTAVA
jgi:Ca2+-binding RTX toxin-like protein